MLKVFSFDKLISSKEIISIPPPPDTIQYHQSKYTQLKPLRDKMVTHEQHTTYNIDKFGTFLKPKFVIFDEGKFYINRNLNPQPNIKMFYSVLLSLLAQPYTLQY